VEIQADAKGNNPMASDAKKKNLLGDTGGGTESKKGRE
jgi:hypothetical protein